MPGDRTASELSADHRWVDEVARGRGGVGLAVAIAWSLGEPDRIGEIAVLPEGRPMWIGRGDEPTARFVRHRPSGSRPGGPLEGKLLSRRQLELVASGDQVRIENVGACALKVGGAIVRSAVLAPGDAFELDRQLVLLVVRRGELPEGPLSEPPFGRADPNGIVGESEAAWELRSRLAFVGRRGDPVLVLGESGTGKELAARAIHAGSDRARGPFVARNAATLPEGLMDAELFGNARSYPNAGMPERPGLIGAADGGTLFLDEIGELPSALQAHLLRVLDAGGEYQRLGESRARRADLRFVAATNRDPSELKHDLLARMPLRVELPGLGERREDVPLLLRHLLREVRADRDLAERFFDGDDARVAPDLVQALLVHAWTHHVRELAAILWRAVETSTGRALALTPEVKERLRAVTPPPRELHGPEVEDRELDEDAVRAALSAAGGNVTEAARHLGLSSRFALYRRMKKLGIDEPR